MLDFAKAFHEAIGIESPRLFIGSFAIVGLLLFGLIGWVVDRGYRVKLKEQAPVERATQSNPSAKPISSFQAAQEAAQERTKELKAQLPAPIASPPVAATTPAPATPLPAAPPDPTHKRIFLPPDVDAYYLREIRGTHTAVQTDLLEVAYIGKWMKLSATVQEVTDVKLNTKGVEDPVMVTVVMGSTEKGNHLVPRCYFRGDGVTSWWHFVKERASRQYAKSGLWVLWDLC